MIRNGVFGDLRENLDWKIRLAIVNFTPAWAGLSSALVMALGLARQWGKNENSI